MALFYVLLDYIWHRMLSRSVFTIKLATTLVIWITDYYFSNTCFWKSETVRFNYFTYLRCSDWLIVIRTFTTYLQNLGPDIFYKNIALAIFAFIAFGIIGYFFVGDASSIGKYLFVTLITLIIASLIGIFLQNPIFYTIITVVSLLLFLLYTLYDFNRLKEVTIHQEKWDLIYLLICWILLRIYFTLLICSEDKQLN